MNIQIDLTNENFQLIINCCRVQLSQVILNLLGNSFDAIENLEERWVEVRCEKNEQNLIIKLIDSGNGIPSAIKEKIIRLVKVRLFYSDKVFKHESSVCHYFQLFQIYI